MDNMRDVMAMNYAAVFEMLNNARINLCHRFRRATPLSGSSSRARHLSGKVCVITGANAGVGLATAKLLAANGANVVMACRSRQRGEAAVQEVLDGLAAIPNSGRLSNKDGSRQHQGPASKTDLGSEESEPSVSFEQLDLASLASVRDFAKRLQQRQRHVDLLICNAGIMAPPERLQTEDGLEQQFQVNYLSQWLLASTLLLPAASDKSASSKRSPKPPARVIMVTSVTHNGGRLNFDDLQHEKHYDPLKAYADTKLAAVMAAQELQRRFERCGSSNTAVVMDPGILDTYLARNFFNSQVPRLLRPINSFTLPWFLLPPAAAARSMLWAATAPDDQVKGKLVKNCRIGKPVRHAGDQAVSDRLWDVSCQLTGFKYNEE